MLKSLLLISTTPPFIKLSGFKHSYLATKAKDGKTRPRSPETFETLLRIDIIQR